MRWRLSVPCSDTSRLDGFFRPGVFCCRRPCTLGGVQEREFWQLLEEVFGRSYGRALAHDQVLDRLDGMAAVEALDAGEEPRVVWNVLCDQMGVPDERRWGKDHNAPPMPVR